MCVCPVHPYVLSNFIRSLPSKEQPQAAWMTVLADRPRPSNALASGPTLAPIPESPP